MYQPDNDYMEKAKDAIFLSLCAIFGCDPEQPSSEERFRFSWPTNEGSAHFEFSPTEDVCYIRLSNGNLNNAGYINTRYGGIDKQSLQAVEKDTHLALRADYLFYGPHSCEYANRLYMMIHSFEAREILRSANMAPVPHGGLPNHFPELIDGNWYERYDLGLDYYMLVKYVGTVPPMLIAPDINTVINE